MVKCYSEMLDTICKNLSFEHERQIRKLSPKEVATTLRNGLSKKQYAYLIAYHQLWEKMWGNNSKLI